MPAQRSGFTTRATCLLAAGGTALVCGLLLGIVDLARAGVLALAVPLLSALVVVRSRVLIANQRSTDPARAHSGETVVVNLTLTNRSLLPSGSLLLEDQLPAQFSGRARFVVDGLLGKESRTVSYRMPRLPRGRYRTGPLHLHLTDPFHLIDVRRSFTSTNDVLVTPIVDPLVHGDPPRSMDVGDDIGSHSIGARGADDASTREYRTGDDLRKIHWRSSARTGSLMVRQEERPWHGHLTVLVDVRQTAHVERAATPGVEEDDRLRSSLEWAISAAASVGTNGVLAGRNLDLLSDLVSPAPLRMSSANQLADHLATLRASQRPDLTPFGPALDTLSRESTVVAIVGELDASSLRTLGKVHPRGSSRAALALILDTVTWAQPPEAHSDEALAPHSVGESDSAVATAAVLNAAGWQTAIVSCGTSMDQAWQRVNSRAASVRSTVLLR